MLRPSGKRRMPPRAMARRGGSLQPSMYIMPLTRWTSRSPATPVPYSFQQRQRAKIFGSNGRFGTSFCQVSQSSVCGERSGGGGYCHAPVGSFRPSEPSTRVSSPTMPFDSSSFPFRPTNGPPRRGPPCPGPAGRLPPPPHGDPSPRRVRHRLLAVAVLPRAARLDDEALVPVVGNRRDQAVDPLVVEQLLVPARRTQLRPRDLPGERVPAVVEIAGRDALDTG